MNKKIQRSYIREILDAINEETISFAGGLPNEKLFPLKQLKDSTLKVMDNSLSIQYSKSQGIDSLREKIAKIYTHKFDFPTKKEEILITTGSQQAFDIISKTFLNDEVFVQMPSYIGALSAFKILDLNIKGFTNNSSLRRELKNNSAVYIMSDFTNPTGESINEENRAVLSHILNEKKSFLIEDGAYSLLDFKGKIRKPICALVEKSFHLGSFSKIIAPGFRIGWIRAKQDLLEKILASKEAVDLHTSTFNQMILNQYLEDNVLFEHVLNVRLEYEKKMNFMAECFEEHLPSFKFTRPKGGMFIYGSFDEDSFSLAKRSLEKNIAFVPAKVFFHNAQESKEARFNFTNCSFDDIKKGIIEISKLLNK